MTDDVNATLARFEQVLDLLRTRYIREGWQIDNAAAERALAYFRKSAQGVEDEGLFQDAIQFIGGHGQSLDWILAGDVGGMICTLAAHSKRAELIQAGHAMEDPVPTLEERMRKANLRLAHSQP